MPALTVHSINKGGLANECVWLGVSEDIPSLAHYILCDTTFVDDNSISNEFRHMFWFINKAVKKGDWVKVMTKEGSNTSAFNSQGGTTHIFYWKLSQPIWTASTDAAIVFHLNTWNTTRAQFVRQFTDLDVFTCKRLSMNMNIEELEKKLSDCGVNALHYRMGSFGAGKSNAFHLKVEGANFALYYTDQEQESFLISFDSESNACEFLLTELTKGDMYSVHIVGAFPTKNQADQLANHLITMRVRVKTDAIQLPTSEIRYRVIVFGLDRKEVAYIVVNGMLKRGK